MNDPLCHCIKTCLVKIWFFTPLPSMSGPSVISNYSGNYRPIIWFEHVCWHSFEIIKYENSQKTSSNFRIKYIRIKITNLDTNSQLITLLVDKRKFKQFAPRSHLPPLMKGFGRCYFECQEWHKMTLLYKPENITSWIGNFIYWKVV